MLAAAGHNGYFACVSGLASSYQSWRCAGAPISAICQPTDQGVRVVPRKVHLQGPAWNAWKRIRAECATSDMYCNPGPVQLSGVGCESVTETLKQGQTQWGSDKNYLSTLDHLRSKIEELSAACRPGCETRLAEILQLYELPTTELGAKTLVNQPLCQDEVAVLDMARPGLKELGNPLSDADCKRIGVNPGRRVKVDRGLIQHAPEGQYFDAHGPPPEFGDNAAFNKFKKEVVEGAAAIYATHEAAAELGPAAGRHSLGRAGAAYLAAAGPANSWKVRSLTCSVVVLQNVDCDQQYNLEQHGQDQHRTGQCNVHGACHGVFHVASARLHERCRVGQRNVGQHDFERAARCSWSGSLPSSPRGSWMAATLRLDHAALETAWLMDVCAFHAFAVLVPANAGWQIPLNPLGPIMHVAAVLLFTGAATVGAASSSPWRHSYDYQGVVEHYCHERKDWGKLPARPENASQLLQVQVFIRHGARTQCSTKPACWAAEDQDTGSYTCDLSFMENTVLGVDGAGGPAGPFFRTVYLPGRNALPGGGNCMVGQLVKSGFDMEVQNGQRLREAYVDREGFLPVALADVDPEVFMKDFFLRSTDVPRTRQSGMALFTGIYGDVDTGRMPHITLNTMDFANENMLVSNACPEAAQLAQRRYFETLENEEEILNLCRQLAPSSVDSSSTNDCFWFLQHLVDCLMSRACPTVPFQPHNSTIPPEFLSDDAALFRKVWAATDTAQHGYFKALARLGIGPFVGEVLHAAKGALNGSAPKFLLFSGHDTGPMEPLWAAFGLRPTPPYWPPFASMLVLEVWNSSGGPLTRWISNGEVAGGGTAPFESFAHQAEALVPGREECEATGDDLARAPLRGLAPAWGLPREALFRQDGYAFAACAWVLAMLAGAGAVRSGFYVHRRTVCLRMLCVSSGSGQEEGTFGMRREKKKPRSAARACMNAFPTCSCLIQFCLHLVSPRPLTT
ncbi:unnamed protein product [Prorocentrum cordatum]|uniref:Uncharacterized protein n=1 Tax=Prorocentrum cordatum TaxID=2364126 RepID=A0ABN9WNS9_9DINO|nr:unnamed protein product [Polarella glacialis]